MYFGSTNHFLKYITYFDVHKHAHYNKHKRELIEFFKEFRIFIFENCHNIAKQITMGLGIEIRFKSHHIHH